jgi:hypothetical protein
MYYFYDRYTKDLTLKEINPIITKTHKKVSTHLHQMIFVDSANNKFCWYTSKLNPVYIINQTYKMKFNIKDYIDKTEMYIVEYPRIETA